MEVIFFWNGNTAVFQGDKQQPELQRPWIMLVAEFLESRGIDPLECTFQLSADHSAKFFRTSDGTLNWEVK